MRAILTLPLFLLAIVAAGATATAQPAGTDQYWIYGQTVENRASTRLGYWFRNRNAGLGEVVVSYGRPVWKDQYAVGLDAMTRGKMWRLGDNYWSLFDTNLPVTVGGVAVAEGLYYLAVSRSADGSRWELVFIDPEKSRQAQLDAYDVGTRPAEIPVLFSAPLSFEKLESEPVDPLTILLKLDEGSNTRGSLRISWGTLSLSTPVEVMLPSENSS